jgi:16S rRNA (guanine1207-N2)-methyltransferase
MMTEEPDKRITPDEHYFAPSPSSAEKTTDFTIESSRGPLTMRAGSGVFSQHGLDKGTAVLLDIMARQNPAPCPPGTNVLDIGCGSGAISLTMAIQYADSTVYAIDINERARELCTENATKNNLSNIRVAHPDEVDANIRFTHIWSNPPIRIGKDALHELLFTWLHRLTDDGSAHLVVSKNLGADSLATWLTANGFATTRIGSSKGFRVLKVLAHR